MVKIEMGNKHLQARCHAKYCFTMNESGWAKFKKIAGLAFLNCLYFFSFVEPPSPECRACFRLSVLVPPHKACLSYPESPCSVCHRGSKKRKRKRKRSLEDMSLVSPRIVKWFAFLHLMFFCVCFSSFKPPKENPKTTGGKTQTRYSQVKNDSKQCRYIASSRSPNRTTKAVSSGGGIKDGGVVGPVMVLGS